MEKVHGSSYPGLATILEELSLVYFAQKRYVEAETALLRAISIRENQYGSHHFITARDQADLATVQVLLGKTEEADGRFQAALAVLESTSSPNEAMLDIILYSYAKALVIAGVKLDQAEAYLKRSLTIREKALKPNNPRLVKALKTYAKLLRMTGRQQEAEVVVNRVQRLSRTNSN